MASDLHVVSELLLKLMLYPIVGWSALLLVLYVVGHVGWGLVLCFPLSLWLGACTVWWAVITRRRWTEQDVAKADVVAGVRALGHILAGASSTPALVFLANDPFSSSAWSTTVGVGIVSGVAYVAVSLLVRIARRPALIGALALAWTSLPINAMGAVTVATMLGWYDTVAERTPIPERPTGMP
ncbi:MAG: hypothetical protein ACI8PZ_002538 [Myxococcota bacterium]|jgi:hypothetical protein